MVPHCYPPESAKSRVFLRWWPLVELTHAILQRRGVPAIADEPGNAVAPNKGPCGDACNHCGGWRMDGQISQHISTYSSYQIYLQLQ